MYKQIFITSFIFVIILLSVYILYLLFTINTNLKQETGQLEHMNKHHETNENIDSVKNNNNESSVVAVGDNKNRNGKEPIFNGSQNELLRYDCDVETIYSMDDSMCASLCRPPNIFHAKNGQCVNILTFNHTEAIDNCNPQYGLVAFIVGDPQLGTAKSFCLSIDLGIQSDTSFNDNKICENGVIDINYLKSFPQIINCTCKDLETQNKFIIPSTNVVREHALCASKNFLDLSSFL